MRHSVVPKIAVLNGTLLL